MNSPIRSELNPATTQEVGGKTQFANAKLVLDDRVIIGCLTMEAGLITVITETTEVPEGAVDCGGDYLIPGLIELHTDNIERHIQPRPSVDWPHDAAILAHDAELASCGITTVFDAMRVGSIPSGKGNYIKYARQLSRELMELRAVSALKISHFLHLRAEVCSETLIEELSEFNEDDRVGIVSLMDHTPGQRQFRDISKLKTYVASKRGMNDAEFEEHCENLYRLRATYGELHEQKTVSEAKRFGAVLASHDDTTTEQVEVSSSYGIRLAEFPTTVEAAEACRANNIAIMMGAPNIIRGGSHSGNVSALELAERDLLDVVSSDYVPAALLLSAFRLAEVWDDVPRAIRTVTANPAASTGLSDRGRLAEGLRADVVRVKALGATPVVRGVWSLGRQVG